MTIDNILNIKENEAYEKFKDISLEQSKLGNMKVKLPIKISAP